MCAYQTVLIVFTLILQTMFQTMCTGGDEENKRRISKLGLVMKNVQKKPNLNQPSPCGQWRLCGGEL